MAHSFKLVYNGYPYNLTNIAIKLAVNQGIHLNRSGIGVDTIRREIKSFTVDPFEKNFFGLQFTYRFNDNDPYTDNVYKEDYGFLDDDFPYTQQMLFSYQDDLEPDQGNNFLIPLFQIVSTLEKENITNSILLYTGPEKATVVYKKMQGVVSVNQSCVNLFNGNLVTMVNSYVPRYR